MPAVFGDFLTAASDHLEAVVVVGDGRVTHLPAITRDLYRLVAVISRYADDLTPCDEVEASGRNDLDAWERAVIDANAALRAAADCLRRNVDLSGDRASATATRRGHHLAAAATKLVAGQDLLHTHLATDPDGLTQDRTEWGPVVTSLPVARALVNEIARWAQQLAPFTGWLAASVTSYALRDAPDHVFSVAISDELANAGQWLRVAGAAMRSALAADPVRAADTELLGAIPSAIVPPRQRPGSAEESVSELCYGITVSASRLRAAVRGSKERAPWSPGTTSGGWQWTAQAAAVTSHLSEQVLRSLATRAGQLSSPPLTGAQLEGAADLMIGMREAWHQVDRTWDVVVTENRATPTPTSAMTDASDLLLRMGRLVWDNPHWTPARADRASRKTPAALAPRAASVNTVVAAAHQAVDALARIAMTDIEAVEAAWEADRLYVPRRLLPDDYDGPPRFGPAPAAQFRALQEAYRAAMNSSIEAARVLDELTVTARAPSMALGLARAATPVQSRRRASQPIPDDDSLRDRLPGTLSFEDSRAATGQAGLLERAIRERQVSEPVLLLRAAAIDNAAQRLMTAAEKVRSDSGSSDASESRPRAAGGAAAELAAQGFPHDPVTRPPNALPGVRPGSPSGAAAVTWRTESRGRDAGRHS